MSAPTPTNNGLPEGCPESLRWNPMSELHKLNDHRPDTDCEEIGCTIIELAPPGSRERLRELEAFVKIIDQYNNPIGYLKEKARALYKETK